MINLPIFITLRRPLVTQLLVLITITALTTSVWAQGSSETGETISDMFVVLDADGRSHTVQHTVATYGPALTLKLPGSVIPLEVMFFGPDQKQLQAQNKISPSTLYLTSGSAFARYQHQYGTKVALIEPNTFVLSTPAVPTNIELEEGSLTRSSISWTLPNNLEWTSYNSTAEDIGRWVSANNTLTFHHEGYTDAQLVIEYQEIENTGQNIVDENSFTPTIQKLGCGDINNSTVACTEDSDKDGVPDYRDICVTALGLKTNALGCVKDHVMTLVEINFETGRAYLDVAARVLLDKVAHAISNSEYTGFEIGGHTDNNGAANNNEQLSAKRADAVRHYLILKGVKPNMLIATGYGEKYPVSDNSTEAGRRTNRRIELVIAQ